jgi:hypothetical protein
MRTAAPDQAHFIWAAAENAAAGAVKACAFVDASFFAATWSTVWQTSGVWGVLFFKWREKIGRIVRG